MFEGILMDGGQMLIIFFGFLFTAIVIGAVATLKTIK
jgi:hypothetical protein